MSAAFDFDFDFCGKQECPRVSNPFAIFAQGRDSTAPSPVGFFHARVARAPSPANTLERLVNLRPAQSHLLFRSLPRFRSPRNNHTQPAFKIIDFQLRARENRAWIGAVSRRVRNPDVPRNRPKHVFGDLLRVKSLFLKTLRERSSLTV